MKKRTQTDSSPYTPCFIDTAPMHAAYERICALMLSLLDIEDLRGVIRQTQKIIRLVRDLSKAEFSNRQRALKLEMLSHGPWREQVLKELGGEAKLSAWDRAMARFALRKDKPMSNPEPEQSAWRKTPERLAEETRQKAHARKCARATAHPRIFRDPFRVDDEGQFRLAPVPRLSRPRRDPASIPFDILDYDYDGTHVHKMSGFDAPVMIWPIEFRAAAALERQMIEEREALTVISTQYLGGQTQKPEHRCHDKLAPEGSAFGISLSGPGMTEDGNMPILEKLREAPLAGS